MGPGGDAHRQRRAEYHFGFPLWEVAEQPACPRGLIGRGGGVVWAVREDTPPRPSECRDRLGFGTCDEVSCHVSWRGQDEIGSHRSRNDEVQDLSGIISNN